MDSGSNFDNSNESSDSDDRGERQIAHPFWNSLILAQS
jgi:hypothetical protein